MFVYCILPDKILKSNFVKIGYCTDYKNLKKRYITYYGTDIRIFYVKVKEKSVEKNIHKELKKWVYI